MASSLPCTSCLTGAVHSGTPKGVEKVIHGLNTYVAFPPASSSNASTPSAAERVDVGERVGEGDKGEGKGESIKGDGITKVKGIIVMIPDAFGWKMVNNRLLCDTYAERGGWIVLLPDFMDGHALPIASLGLPEQITTPSSWTHTLFTKPILLARALGLGLPPFYRIRSSLCRPRIISFLQALRSESLPFSSAGEKNGESRPGEEEGKDGNARGKETVKIGIAAFCWGGQHAFYLAQDREGERVVPYNSSLLPPASDPSSASSDQNQQQQKARAEAASTLKETNPKKPLVDCIFTAHPSLFTFPGDVEKVELPISVCIGDDDLWMKKKDIQGMKVILEKKERRGGDGGRDGGGEVRVGDAEAEVMNECVLLPGARHGFAVRSWEDDEVQMGFAKVAEDQALKWFERWLS